VSLLSRIHHRNLVKFYGFCQEGDKDILIYEFMHNGTLKEHLYEAFGFFNRGGEFLSKEFSGFSNEHGIKRELIAPCTPEHNGIGERKNRTIVEMARCTLKAKNLEDAF
nr:probable LRR receptor-like serine/threonine-protein kinase At1g67720 isoform X2 [Tanacetum cinerariifolium]